MLQISQLTKIKMNYSNNWKNIKKHIYIKTQINTLNEKLSTSQAEVNRLSNDLTKQQEQYIKLQQSKQEESTRLGRQLSVKSEQIVAEYEAKQEELLQIIQDQKNMINELEVENQELQNYK